MALSSSVEVEHEIGQLRDAAEQMRTWLASQADISSSKMFVAFPVFSGDECEDVREFISNFKRAEKLNGWNDDKLALGLPLYLKGHASIWFKTLENSDDMNFEELSAAFISQFASGASKWRIRQELSQRRQLEKESVADYSYNIRSHCAQLILPRSEWMHYFVLGLKPEIREYVILQQPENLEAAENFAKLKESVLTSTENAPKFDVKEISAQIIEELSKTMVHKDKKIGAVRQQVINVDKPDIKQMIRDEFQRLMGTASPKPTSFRRSTGQGCKTRVDQYYGSAPNCYNCGRKGHTYKFCRSNPNPRIPRYNCNRQNSFFPERCSQNSFHWNTEQGNGLVPLSLVEIMA